MNKEIIVLAVKCKHCGHWNAKKTFNLSHCYSKCKMCGKNFKLRSLGNWNATVRLLREGESLIELVARLNCLESKQEGILYGSELL